MGSSSCEWGVGECLPVPVPAVPASFNHFVLKIKSTTLHHNLIICSIFTQLFMNIKFYLYDLTSNMYKLSDPAEYCVFLPFQENKHLEKRNSSF